MQSTTTRLQQFARVLALAGQIDASIKALLREVAAIERDRSLTEEECLNFSDAVMKFVEIASGLPAIARDIGVAPAVLASLERVCAEYRGTLWRAPSAEELA